MLPKEISVKENGSYIAMLRNNLVSQNDSVA